MLLWGLDFDGNRYPETDASCGHALAGGEERRHPPENCNEVKG